MIAGILTYQNTLNFGAALQCYALYRSIEEIGIDVEIIDYRNDKITNNTKVISIATNRGKNKIGIKSLSKAIVMTPLLNSKRKAFEKFNAKYVKFSTKTYNFELINSDPPVYDKYIIGSDQVWNYNINGMDTTYFMDFVRDKVDIFTYASSFGLDSIDEDKKETYRKNLGNIKSISVREKKGADIIKDLLNIDVKVVADPVFLLSQNEWTKLINVKSHDLKKQVVSYFLNHNTRKQFENSLKADEELLNYMIVKLAGGISFSDYISNKTIVNLSNGPTDFVKYIDESEFICTDSFHATVFSIIFKKKFLVFLSGDAGRDSRIINLLEQFDLQSQIYRGDLTPLYNEVNPEKIDSIVEKMRLSGLMYIKENLEGLFLKEKKNG